MTANLFGQVRAIAVTDLRLRLRRPATLWLILILSGLAYAVVPDPATGRALMVVDGSRARYTSQAVAFATATLASLLLTFAGFYLTSNALRRDLLARTGPIIAATPVGSGTYLVGKFLGSAAYLGTVAGAYLLNVMLMHLLRGEAPLEPVTYLATYLLMLGPAIVVVAALALCFESVPWLSGRVGDVGYFFVWMAMLATSAVGEGGGPTRYFDAMGIGFSVGQIKMMSTSHNLSVGMSPFNPAAAPWILPPLSISLGALLARLLPALLAVPILLLARLCFHRFDPARVRSGGQSSGNDLVRRLSRLIKPLARIVSATGARIVPAAPGALRPILAETVMTLCHAPLVLVAWIGTLAATVLVQDETARRVLPIALSVILAIALADLSTRDRAAGVQAMLFSMPRLKPGYARIKLGAAALLALLFVLPPAMRIGVDAPGAALSLLVAASFMAALATALGLLTRTPKTFMGVFLLFLYLVLNGGHVPALDFVGSNGAATGSTRLGYLLLALLLGAVAEGKHRWDLAREG